MTALVTAVYAVVLALLFVYGASSYVWLLRARRFRVATPPAPGAWPPVTVQIPVFDERDVAARVVRAAAALQYPGDLEIQILDDSDDDTPAVVAHAIAGLPPALAARFVHLRRGQRHGFKAGALAAGLAAARGELIAVLDADFVPDPDFLLRTVPHLADPRIACVQTRWEHLNRDVSALTRAQALGIDLHFFVEQRARAAAGWPVAFNGSGGVWRGAAIVEAGGWSADTLTEDLDLSYRAQLRGLRILYLDDVGCPGEIPERLADLKAQQRRWAQGSTETARKLLGPLWRSNLTLAAKLQGTLHLTHYAVHPLMLLSAVMAVPFGLVASGSSLWRAVPPLALATGGPAAMALAAAGIRRLPWRHRWRDLRGMLLLGVGLAVSNSRAVLAALGRHQNEFERTPKGGATSSYAIHGDRLVIVELASAVACAGIAGWLVTRGVLSLVPFLLLYAVGLGRVGLAGWLEARGATEAVTPLAATAEDS